MLPTRTAREGHEVTVTFNSIHHQWALVKTIMSLASISGEDLEEGVVGIITVGGIGISKPRQQVDSSGFRM